MPIYEYRCAKCGEFDIMQRITDKPLRKCPTCKGKVEKLVSNTSFHLKGSGWYLTDYAGKGGKAEGASAKESSKSEKESSKSDSGAAGAGEAKTSSKPEKKGKSTGKSADAA